MLVRTLHAGGLVRSGKYFGLSTSGERTKGEAVDTRSGNMTVALAHLPGNDYVSSLVDLQLELLVVAAKRADLHGYM